MTDETPASAAAWRKARKFVLTTLVATAVGGFIWSQLPSGAYPTDLSRIGSGRPAVVLAQDGNYVGGMAVMELLNAIRGDYAERIDFLVAPLAVADAREFAGRHGAADGTVLLFDASGRRVRLLHQPQTTDELRQALAQAFGL
jgi:hypothetical protein